MTPDWPRQAKRVFEHAQHAHIQIILRMRNVLSWHVLFTDTFYGQMILLADSEGSDQTARMRKLIWALTVIYARRHVFAWRGLDNNTFICTIVYFNILNQIAIERIMYITRSKIVFQNTKSIWKTG